MPFSGFFKYKVRKFKNIILTNCIKKKHNMNVDVTNNEICSKFGKKEVL